MEVLTLSKTQKYDIWAIGFFGKGEHCFEPPFPRQTQIVHHLELGRQHCFDTTQTRRQTNPFQFFHIKRRRQEHMGRCLWLWWHWIQCWMWSNRDQRFYLVWEIMRFFYYCNSVRCTWFQLCHVHNCFCNSLI